MGSPGTPQASAEPRPAISQSGSGPSLSCRYPPPLLPRPEGERTGRDQRLQGLERQRATL